MRVDWRRTKAAETSRRALAAERRRRHAVGRQGGRPATGRDHASTNHVGRTNRRWGCSRVRAAPSERTMSKRQHEAAAGASVPVASKRARDAPSMLARPPSVGSSLIPKPVLEGWREQLTLHGGTRPVWLRRELILPGTHVADTLAHVPDADPQAVAGVELWAQRRSVSSPMHLHWDCDEEHCRLTRELRCPSRTCVVYISDAGGPTLLLELRHGEQWCEEVRGFACWPRAGQSLSFPGDWLHGILAAPGPTDALGVQDAAALRETVVLNLWTETPTDLPELGEDDVPSTPCPGAAPGVEDVQPLPCTRLRGRGRSTAAWRWTTLTVGTRDGMETLELLLPPMPEGSEGLEEFTAKVRRAPDASRIGPFYSGPGLA